MLFDFLRSLSHNFTLFVLNQDSSRTNFISTFCATEPKHHTSFVTALSRKPFYWTLWAVSWQWYQKNELENAVKATSLIFKSSPSMTLSPKQAKGQSCSPPPRALANIRPPVNCSRLASSPLWTGINRSSGQKARHSSRVLEPRIWKWKKKKAMSFFPPNDTVKLNKNIFQVFALLYSFISMNYCYFIILLLL